MSRWQIYEATTDFDGVVCYIKRGEIVRCRECKHRQNPHAPKWCYEMSKETDADDFCSYGERSE